ncbi:MAG: slipin family protein [Elusimicrobiota bacterium]
MGSLLTLGIIAFFIITSAVRIVKEYERGVIFRLGRLVGAKGPGLFFIIPIVDQMVKVDLRTLTLDVPVQEVITKDNVPLKVNALVYFRVLDPCNAVVKIQNYIIATSQIAQTTLRSIVGQAEFDEVLGEREKLNAQLQKIIDERTDPWGIKVSIVEIKDVEIPQDMQRAIARQAEAERERRAKVIAAEGEFQAAEKLSQAADIMSKNPTTIQLRYLQTMLEMSGKDKATTIIPFPIDVLKSLSGRGN